MEHKVRLTFYGGVNKVGGNKVFLEDIGYNVKLFLDFGINWDEYSQCCRKTYDPDRLENFTDTQVLPANDIVPVQNLYSKNFIFNHKQIGIREKLKDCENKVDPPSDLDAILISHPHRDHYSGLSFVNRNIPIYSGVVTKRIIETSSICKAPRAENFFHGLNWKLFRTGDVINLNKMEIHPVHVDHSVPASYGFIICSSAGLIVYTGDFRMHGVMKHMTFDLIKKVEEVRKTKGKIESNFKYSEGRVVALISEGTHVHKGAMESEKRVKKQIKELFKPMIYDYLIIQYQRVDWDRFRTFANIAKKYKWKYIIDEKDAYYYYQLNKDAIYDSMKNPDIIAQNNIYIISDGRGQFPWHRDIRKVLRREKIDDRVLRLEDLKHMKGKFCIYISYKDDLERIKSYLPDDLNGVYISSSIDPYTEEYSGYAKDVQSILREIGIPTYKINASGHAKPHDIIRLAQEVRAERIFPIHTEHAPFFKKLFKNYRTEVILPKINTPIEITEL